MVVAVTSNKECILTSLIGKWSSIILLSLTESDCGSRMQKNDKSTISRKCVSQTPNDKIGWQNFHINIILKKKLYVGNVPPLVPIFPLAPLPPNFNVDFWNIREHVTAKRNLPTLKMGEGGCFLGPLIEMPFWLLIFLTFLQFCQQFCRWVSEENFFRMTLVHLFLHSQTTLRCDMRLQDHSWQNC